MDALSLTEMFFGAALAAWLTHPASGETRMTLPEALRDPTACRGNPKSWRVLAAGFAAFLVSFGLVILADRLQSRPLRDVAGGIGSLSVGAIMSAASFNTTLRK